MKSDVINVRIRGVYMAGKLCPNCKSRTLFVSGDNERTCTKCGYKEMIDPFFHIKEFFAELVGLGVLTAIVSAILAAFGLDTVVLIGAGAAAALFFVLLIAAIVRKENVWRGIKRFIFSIICAAISFIVAALVS